MKTYAPIALLAVLVALVWWWAAGGGERAPRRSAPVATKPAKAKGLSAKAKPKAARARPADDEDEAYVQLARDCMAGDKAACKERRRLRAAREEATDQAPVNSGGHALPRPRDETPIDPNVLRIANDLALVEYRCAGGEKTACARLSRGDDEGRRLLAKMRARLKRSCDDRFAQGCLMRAGLEMKSGRIDDASAWLKKAKTIATAVKSRCEAKQETSAAVCDEALAHLKEVASREKEAASLRN